MKYFDCDNCKKTTTGDPDIWLNGITGTSGGILLPSRFIEKHFCSVDCFWEWIDKFHPKKVN